MRPLPRIPPDVLGHVGQYLDVEDLATVRRAIPQASHYPPLAQFVYNTEDPDTLLRYYEHSGNHTALDKAFEMYFTAPHVFREVPEVFQPLFVTYVRDKIHRGKIEEVLNYLYLVPDRLKLTTVSPIMIMVAEECEDISPGLDFWNDIHDPYVSKRMDEDFQKMSLDELLLYDKRFLPHMTVSPFETLLERFSDEEVLKIIYEDYEESDRRTKQRGMDQLRDLVHDVSGEYRARANNIVQTLRDIRRTLRRQSRPE